MIQEKTDLAKQILENYSETAGDNGSGAFLNKVYEKLYGNEPINFKKFSVESWTRARRKALELNPELDKRTKYTNEQVQQVKREVA